MLSLVVFLLRFKVGFLVSTLLRWQTLHFLREQKCVYSCYWQRQKNIKYAKTLRYAVRVLKCLWIQSTGLGGRHLRLVLLFGLLLFLWKFSGLSLAFTGQGAAVCWSVHRKRGRKREEGHTVWSGISEAHSFTLASPALYWLTKRKGHVNFNLCLLQLFVWLGCPDDPNRRL